VGVNPTTNRIYVANVDSNDVSVIDGATNTEIDTDGNSANGITRIPVGAAPAGVVANPTTNRIYVTNQNSNDVSVIDGATNTEIDTDGNAANGITRISVGSGPVGVALNPTTDRIYVANFSWGSGSVSVIDATTNTEIDTDGNPVNGITRIPVGARPHLVAVNTITNRIYVANWGNDDVSVIDGASNTEIDTDGNPANGITRIPVGSRPNGADANPTTNRVYIGNAASQDVSVIDGATNTEIDTDGNPANGITRIPVGSNVLGVAANPATNRIYVANPLSNNISVIDGATNAVTATATVGSYPYAVTVNPTTNRIYVTNRDDNTVSVIEDLPPAVGGIAELPAVETNAAAGDTGSSAPGPLALAGLAAVGALLLVTGALYAGRRWGR
jgi:YVTN family beta-propeller protein